ncbi:MAG: FKBP-type peptidyl-prolyl cis-trans isomerase [Clostridium sp.]|nr:FKBP-type peptidyl-prolyl cis-trans isomerase [Clostridium sp.]
MKAMKGTICALAMLLACSGGFAKGKQKTRKGKKAVAEKVDTCSVDTFSYAFGMANTQGLTQYLSSRMGVDMAYLADFLKGFDAGNSESEEVKKMRAYCAGADIHTQVLNQIIPNINKQIADNDSVKTLNEELFVKAFRMAIAGEDTGMPMDTAQSLVKKQMEYYQSVNMERKYGENKQVGLDYLKTYAKEKGVKTLDGGVMYKVLTEGTGEMPTAESKVKVNYEGKLVDGTVFDSSYDRKEPTSFACNQVIKGWTTALTHMPVGSKWEIVIPQEMGYGAREAGKIKPFSTLIFTVELLEIEK